MTPQQIIDRVNEEASVRFIEVIERVLPTLRNRHAHQACLKECHCDYCRFITNIYTEEKIYLHKKKVLLNRFEFEFWDDEITKERWHQLWDQVNAQKRKVTELKKFKNELKADII